MRQYSLSVLGVHLASLFADSHELVYPNQERKPGHSVAVGIMLKGHSGYVAIVQVRPGAVLEYRERDGELAEVFTEVIIPPAIESETCAIAQPAPE